MNVIHRAAVATVIISNLSLQVALTTAAHAEERPDRELSNVRLTGVLIQPDRQLAIFAVKGVKGAETRILSVGQALNGWKLDSISPEGVSLSGPGGTRTLQPKIDSKLVRQARLPAAPAQPQPAAAPRQAPGTAAGWCCACQATDTAPGGRPACSSTRGGTGTASRGQTPAVGEAVRSKRPDAPSVGGAAMDPDSIAAAAQSERRRSWWLSNAAADDSSEAVHTR